MFFFLSFNFHSKVRSSPFKEKICIKLGTPLNAGHCCLLGNVPPNGSFSILLFFAITMEYSNFMWWFLRIRIWNRSILVVRSKRIENKIYFEIRIEDKNLLKLDHNQQQMFNNYCFSLTWMRKKMKKFVFEQEFQMLNLKIK